MPNLKKIKYKNNHKYESIANPILILSDNKEYVDAGCIIKKDGFYVWRPPRDAKYLGHHITGSVAEELYRLNFPKSKSRHQIRRK